MCLPWTIRNWRVFHEFVFLRGNFGALLWAGNHGSGNFYHGGDFLPEFHLIVDDLRAYGEPEMNSQCKARAIAYIKADPVRFIRACSQRAKIFWGKEVWFGAFPKLTAITTGIPFLFGIAGLLIGWCRRWRVGAFTAIFLLYPAVYYITLAEARYRFPIEPFIVILAAAAISHWIRTWNYKPNPQGISRRVPTSS